MIEDTKQDPNSFHLAGIIPVAGVESEFNFEWSDVLVPVAPDFNAIELAVLECSYAGCETIWIVCNDDTAPLIKERIGDYVKDIDSVHRGKHVRFGSERHTHIPVYYVPIHPRHRNKIDCYPWSILHGANVAYWICSRLSRWMTPDKYYVSFPLGVYDPREISKRRPEIRSKERFYFSFKGKTVADGCLLGFAFDAAEWRRARDVIKGNSKAYYPPPAGERFPSQKLPPEQRLVSRNYNLQDVFRDADQSTANISELPWFYDLTTWEEYCTLLSSVNRETLRRPDDLIFRAGRMDSIGDQP